MPDRIQRKRTKGWKMPEGAIYVGRPTKWGNPVKMDGWQGAMQSVMMWGCRGDKRGRAEAAVRAYRLILEAETKPVAKDTRDDWQRAVYTIRCDRVIPTIEEIRTELRGKTLACFCPLDQPCHADVLLELANA